LHPARKEQCSANAGPCQPGCYSGSSRPVPVGEQGLFNGDVVLDRLRVEIPKFEFVTDSPLEGDGFEPSVPLYILTVSDPR